MEIMEKSRIRKMKRFVSLLLSVLLLVSMATIPAYAESEPTLALSRASVTAGSEVELLLSVRDHAGLKGLSAEVDYDDTVLTLVSAVPKTQLGTWDVDTIDQDHVLFWYSTESFTEEVLVGLRFRVAEDAAVGESPVSLRFGDWRGVYDAQGEAIEAYSVVPGAVNVIEEPEARIYGTSISAAGNIGLNVFLTFSEELVGDKDAYVTVDEQRFPISQAAKVSQQGLTLYRFSVERAAPLMQRPAVIRVYHGSGEEASLWAVNTLFTGVGYSTTVQDYLDRVLVSGSGRKLLDLAAAMSDYGRFAQLFFRQNLDQLSEIHGDVDSVGLKELEPFAAVVNQEENGGVCLYGSNLTVETNTIMRHFFQLRSGSIGDYRFLLDGKEVEPTAIGGYWSVDLPGIPAALLDTWHTIQVMDGETEIVNTRFCALSYCYTTLTNSKDANLCSLVKAIYLYNEAANVYFSA